MKNVAAIMVVTKQKQDSRDGTDFHSSDGICEMGVTKKHCVFTLHFDCNFRVHVAF